MSKLVIVESPAKAKTIEKYLGKDFKVKASVGHLVDLPRKSLGVDVEKDFKPDYEVMPEKKKTAAELKKAAKSADEIYLAPDPDREGEAIAWHIARLLSESNKPMKRVLINEITKPAVTKAIEQAGEIDENRFNAQQARRVLDRLVGYQISPIISKKFKTGLSAGRVQSVALRLVVEREKAIRSHTPREYWSIDARLSKGSPPAFTARLVSIDGKSLEVPERFDKDNNAFIPLDLEKYTFIPDGDTAQKIVNTVSKKPFAAKEVIKQERKRNPPPPFITSSLQQEAARKLGFTAKKTMTTAQRLYEGMDVGEGAVGLITYMRTDSTRVADPALQMVRDYIRQNFGDKFLPDKPRSYKSKGGAQEAHEAIRPTSMDRTPDKVAPFLERDQLRLYELIFLRFAASQMEPAVYDQTTVDMPVNGYLFRATGRVIKFKGFLAVYEEAQDDDAESGEDRELPPLKEGDKLELEELVPEQHFTKPPPRFTEASLVRELEERGIGRPSTYAQILSTIQERKYVEKEQRRFYPTSLGEMINSILVAAFPDIMDVGFTAQMENDLDKVEEGQRDWVALLKSFYEPFSRRLTQASRIIDEMQQEPTDLECPLCGRELMVKLARKGEFLGCSGYPECPYTTDFERDDKGDIIPSETSTLEKPCPKCGRPLQIRQGKQGEFVGCSGYPECNYTADVERDEQGKARIIERQEEDTGISCDKCGRPMVIKRTRKGNREFLACSGYPECKNARDFKRDEDGKIIVLERPEEEDTGIKCEQCGKTLVIKRARRSGKEFLACPGYPDCKNAKDFIRNEDGTVRPVEVGDEAGTCEACGRPLVLKRGRYGTFWACSGYPDCNIIVGSDGKQTQKSAKSTAKKTSKKSASKKSAAKKSAAGKTSKKDTKASKS